MVYSVALRTIAQDERHSDSSKGQFQRDKNSSKDIYEFLLGENELCSQI